MGYLEPDASLLTLFLHFRPGALGEVLHCYIFSHSIDAFKNGCQAYLEVNVMELLIEESEQNRASWLPRKTSFQRR